MKTGRAFKECVFISVAALQQLHSVELVSRYNGQCYSLWWCCPDFFSIVGDGTTRQML